MFRFRFTVRQMMVAVAVAAVVLWGVNLRRLSASYREKAIRAQQESKFIQGGCYFDFDEKAAPSEKIKKKRSWEAARDRCSIYWYRLQAKYERAARHPWLPVAPDPPEPK